MTRNELYAALSDGLGIPVAYLKFTAPQKLPFAVWGIPSETSYYSDNNAAMRIFDGWLELYTAAADFELQGKVEAVLSATGRPWSKTNEVYLDDEKMFMTIWNFQLF